MTADETGVGFPSLMGFPRIFWRIYINECKFYTMNKTHALSINGVRIRFR